MLIWLDMEMSGLRPDHDRILEVAMVITDNDLEQVAVSPILVIHQSDEILNAMDDWNKSTHGRTGLIEKVRHSPTSEWEAEQMMLDFLSQHVKANSSPMCGNSIGQDRRFMARYMPRLEAFFHYRNLDVSTLKELARRWRPELCRRLEKKGRHEALADILESIEELKFYRQHFLRLSEETS
jgi:oligoribonuclease